MEQGTFLLFLGAMSIIALFVFIALYFVKAGYGMFRTASWGISINNKLAWMLMEAPVFIVMLLLWWNSARYNSIAPLIFFLLFQFGHKDTHKEWIISYNAVKECFSAVYFT